ncbi:FKBP-type peptidyl-prolyl cis-trans isomerase [Hymenobacter taeanensis]|uniref:Peptidyl-prolyl cis-trans isomerase n=1 Tax=Hymenobacter taeanensis TaxID=2735321 RepID=A0A6M6BGV7_9BACT|nr:MULTISPECIES: FKBP-type peptidyl-prolyl cis-trans isomerase [Hymenobacter]QJX47269.1 FKBP-type peptidyl-prolyl cis-trans isomerase [Hymenobacter taeanensis]UOQ79395.1 FKBP-type peptidyl-prolyl cis-trans isomerase [Hymenobacter sp. 5414T-23]
MRNVFSLTRSTLLLRLAALLLVAAPVLSACDSKGSIAKQTEKLLEQQKAADEASIQAYLTRHNITGSSYTRTSTGLYLINVKEGPASNALIKAGQKVTTVYVGKFIGEANDGVEFDNSSNNRTACGCLNFTAGANSVIQGWEEAVLLMRKGDRKLLLVPSNLAYGSAGSGTSIPPNTPLLFDLEITDVK